MWKGVEAIAKKKKYKNTMTRNYKEFSRNREYLKFLKQNKTKGGAAEAECSDYDCSLDLALEGKKSE